MNLWILTEERPKREVIRAIIQKFAKEKKISHFSDSIRILPMLNESKKFKFTYEVTGFSLSIVEKIYLKIVSGKSSFVDFLIFYQKHEPTLDDKPIFAIEETKTDDQESRNTGIYQRAIKFVYIESYYPGIDRTMLYNLQISSKNPTKTNIFGSRCLRTLGVKIIGKPVNEVLGTPWSSIQEMIDYKSNMNPPPTGNTPINIEKVGSKITISGRLFKSGGLSHDPNIGALTLISATLRELGWGGEIEITQHDLSQNQINTTNKFVLVANQLDLTLEGLSVPTAIRPQDYWHYEQNSEKLGTIFIHIVVENFTTGVSIYENHAGCERGYFITPSGEYIQISKRIPSGHVPHRGVMTNNIELPDLVLLDLDQTQIINIEGKKFEKIEDGIRQLDNFDAIEKFYIKKYYPDYDIIRTVVLYGGTAERIDRCQVSFLLNREGKLVLGIRAPHIFKEAIKNLCSYWNI